MFWLGVLPESHHELPFSVQEILSGLGSAYFRVQGPLGAGEWWEVQPSLLGLFIQEGLTFPLIWKLEPSQKWQWGVSEAPLPAGVCFSALWPGCLSVLTGFSGLGMDILLGRLE